MRKLPIGGTCYIVLWYHSTIVGSTPRYFQVEVTAPSVLCALPCGGPCQSGPRPHMAMAGSF